MAIDFKKTFGESSNARTSNNRQDMPKAQFWLNIGFLSDVKDENGDCKFVSLPMGIPLDTMEQLKTNSSNRDFAMFQRARNDLHDQLMAAAQDLAPGQDYVIQAEGNLAIQIRRVKDEAEAPAADENNPYARPQLFNVAKAA